MRLVNVALLATFVAGVAEANPYPDPGAVPLDEPEFFAPIHVNGPPPLLIRERLLEDATDVLRVRIDWNAGTESWSLGEAGTEPSGTEGFLARSLRPDALGSYRAVLRDPVSGQALAHDSIGTGAEFRKLTRALSFRFPKPEGPVVLEVRAENPETGQSEVVMSTNLGPEHLKSLATKSAEVETRLLREATASPRLLVNIYAEGYAASRKSRFWDDAARVVRAMEGGDFPGEEHFEFRAVFAPSNQSLGSARDLGMPIPVRDSFLGLYYPYWNQFGRWYHVVYPTSEEKFRQGLASAPYDYPIILVDSSSYWGVGNYRELTAIPARSSSFTYLLMHEIGHFFGLNEEYESGGPTELRFAPGITEPWSQNITFLADPAQLKWNDHVDSRTPVPTPTRYWRGGGAYGAYPGGYARSDPGRRSHKPGLSCTMESGGDFCPICAEAIADRVRFDAGQ